MNVKMWWIMVTIARFCHETFVWDWAKKQLRSLKFGRIYTCHCHSKNKDNRSTKLLFFMTSAIKNILIFKFHICNTTVFHRIQCLLVGLFYKNYVKCRSGTFTSIFRQKPLQFLLPICRIVSQLVCFYKNHHKKIVSKKTIQMLVAIFLFFKKVQNFCWFFVV
jgi:hypothetical protein